MSAETFINTDIVAVLEKICIYMRHLWLIDYLYL